MSQRALFLDRDGVINHEVNYLYRIEDVRWVDGIFSLCRKAVLLGYKLVVVTNQAGIARGYYTEADFHVLMEWMRAEFAAQGVPLDAVYFSPYHPQGEVAAYRQEHPDRKPGPGMILRAATDLDLDLGQSVMVGDRCTDVAAGHAAGVGKMFLLSGTEATPCSGEYEAVEQLQQIEGFFDR